MTSSSTGVGWTNWKRKRSRKCSSSSSRVLMLSAKRKGKCHRLGLSKVMTDKLMTLYCSWEEGESVRVVGADAAACSSSSSQLVTAVEAGSAGNAMQRKLAEDAGPSEPGPSGSAIPSWLRASMRRVTHFNLDTPSADRPASAPAGRSPPSPPPTPPPGPDTPDSLGYVSDSTDRQTSAG